MTEQTEHASPGPALPLARAASRMNITPDALRMRLARGRVEGFKRGGRLFVYMNRKTNNVRDDDADAGERELATIVELQRVELNRLLRENNRLSRRADLLLGIQKREQVLRLRLQRTIDGLTGRPGTTNAPAPVAGPETVSVADMERLEVRLEQAERQADRLTQVVRRLVHFLDRDEPA